MKTATLAVLISPSLLRELYKERRCLLLSSALFYRPVFLLYKKATDDAVANGL